MLNFKDLPIRTKLICFIMLSAMLSVLILSSVFVFQRYHSFKQQIQDEISAITHIIADRSNAAVLFEDKTALTETLSSLALHPQIVAACTYSIINVRLAHYTQSTQIRAADSPQNKPSMPDCPQAIHSHESFFSEGYFYISEPIVASNEVVGTIFIKASTAKLRQELLTTTFTALTLSSFVIFLAFALARYIQRFISNPLLELKEATKYVSLDIDHVPQVQKHNNDEIGELVDAFNTMLQTIAEQNKIILTHTDNLEQEVNERTKELALANRELEAFSYSVSHDLKAPLRTIDGFSLALEEDYGDQLDSTALHYLSRVRAGSAKMAQLINNLLQLSRVTRLELKKQQVNLTELATKIVAELTANNQKRDLKLTLQENMYVMGDPVLVEILLDNLVSNAWKYSQKKECSSIEIGCQEQMGNTVYYIKDNGAGFDMKYASQLFKPFNRLHSAEEFEGTGIGLATVARIVERHHGKIWVDSAQEAGTTFFFTLFPQSSNSSVPRAKALSQVKKI